MAYVIFETRRPYLFDSNWQAYWAPCQWLYDLRILNVVGSLGTLRDYAYILGDLLSWCETKGRTWCALTTAEMSGYFNTFDVSNDSLNKKISTIYDFYSWSKARNYIRCAPFELRTKSGRRSRRTQRRLSDWGKSHDFEPALVKKRASPGAKAQIIMPSLKEAWAFRDSMQTDRNKLFAEILMFTGLRVSELTHLRLAQFIGLKLDDSNRSKFITIIGKGNKERKVLFPKSLILRIQQWVSLQRGFSSTKRINTTYLFPGLRGNLSERAVEKIFKITSREKGLSIHPHALRHFFAVHYLKYLQDLKDPSALEQLRELMGHSSIETTQRYLHLTDRERLLLSEDHGSFIAKISNGEKSPYDKDDVKNVLTSVSRYEFNYFATKTL